MDGKLNLNLNLNPNLKPPQEVEGAMYAFPKIDLPPAAIEAAEEAGCPPKKGGVDPAEQTCSIFVFPLGKIKKGEEEKAIRQFVCNPNQEYSTFLRLLPKALSAY